MTPHQRARAVVEAWEECVGTNTCVVQSDMDALTEQVAAALEEEIEACAKVAEQWEDSTQDIDCGVTMVSVLKSGRPDTDGGIVIQEVDKLEPWEQRQAEMLGEYREVARREERRIVAAAIRQRAK